jgi:hypothetical protein
MADPRTPAMNTAMEIVKVRGEDPQAELGGCAKLAAAAAAVAVQVSTAHHALSCTSLAAQAALSGVLGFPLGRSTLGSKISEGDRGRITLQLPGDKPEEAAMLRVQEVITNIIAKVSSHATCCTNITSH